MNHPTHDPAPDPQLRDALEAVAPVPSGEVDWERLRRETLERAALPLARRRREARTSARWLRPALPLALAASLALFVATRLFAPASPAETGIANGSLGFQPVVEEVLGSPISEAELDLLFGQVSADMLVVAALASP